MMQPIKQAHRLENLQRNTTSWINAQKKVTKMSKEQDT